MPPPPKGIADLPYITEVFNQQGKKIAELWTATTFTGDASLIATLIVNAQNIVNQSREFGGRNE